MDSRHPLQGVSAGRVGGASEVAAPTGFLAGDRTSFIGGAAHPGMDGGMTASLGMADDDSFDDPEIRDRSEQMLQR